jgi:hypothetical protein
MKKRLRRLVAAVMSGGALLNLAGCTTGVGADVGVFLGDLWRAGLAAFLL